MEKINLEETKTAVSSEFTKFRDAFDIQKNDDYLADSLLKATQLLEKYCGKDFYTEEKRMEIYPIMELLETLYQEKYDQTKATIRILNMPRGPFKADLQSVFLYKKGVENEKKRKGAGDKKQKNPENQVKDSSGKTKEVIA